MRRPPASLSLDLDNHWSYLKTHGDPGWETFPSYLDTVVPRILSMLGELGLTITVFVVGQDAALERNRPALRAIADAGHEIGNHSFRHEPWLHLYDEAEVGAEIEEAERAITAATGTRPRGFRGPGYSVSRTVLRTLLARGYDYDCSTFPTFVGPLARAYYFLHARLDRTKRAERAALFGGLRDGLRPLAPYRWQLDEGEGTLLEIPVTTMPLSRLPFHFSYLHWLAGGSERLARTHLDAALRLCRARGIAPSLLLHPLDFLGGDDLGDLGFFPGMDQPAERKLARMAGLLARLCEGFEVETVGAHAARAADRPLRVRPARFTAPSAARSGAALASLPR